jgi:hypothetical protein
MSNPARFPLFLKVLNLKMNRIETIEGLDHLEKLELFNIAANR